MKRIIDIIFTLGLLIMISTAFQKTETNDTIYFASLNRAIQLGQFDGIMSIKELLSHGDFGLGSEEKLKGELIILDGIAYGVLADGNARVLPEDSQIPFAAIKFFKPDTTLQMKGRELSFKKLKLYIDSVISTNSFAAIKIKGKFKSVQYRSFYKQEKPYKPVKEVPFNKFELKDLEGTMVGFFTPKSAEVLNSPNHHFHFIDANRTTGGHVLDCTVQEFQIQIDYSRDISIHLPSSEAEQNIDLNKPISAL